MSAKYVRPTRLDRAFNRLVGVSTRLGLSLAGSRVLAVRGRTSGEWRTTPVNPMRIGGERFLVSPRGTTHWVRNLRVSESGELRHGRRVEAFTAVEVADADKPPVLREYLRVWAWEVGRFFEGVEASSPDERLREVAPDFPVFRITSGG